jgi:PKHD-type hydroxylase
MKEDCNYFQIDGAIPSHVCDYIVEMGKEKLQPSYVGPDKEIKKEARDSSVAWLDNQDLIDNIFRICDKVNEELNFELTGMEQLQFTEYKAPSGHYKFHIDGNGIGNYGVSTDSARKGSTRKLSMSCLLSDNFEGGELVMHFGKDEIVHMKKGDAVFFPSYYLHKVSPVTSGIRYSLVTWFVGPPFK